MDIRNKPTDKMLEQLLSTNDIDAYFKENSGYFVDYSVAEYLTYLTEHMNIQKSAVIKKAELNEIYGYQIFSGKRIPSRDKLLCLAIGMGLNLDGVNKLMKIAGYAQLYAKSTRDSVIIHSIANGKSVMDTNAALYNAGEDTL